ncbi:hypothetical protein FHS29_005505 [Saccharothrix tamanrassetensis]|uniref:Restriction endonuclease type IV Mrr domain-containing protein n=1 Tax=Saccharothrix tamanrassetensis TaxID=1051531 RepID=A0A841CTY8_9PSEU|nr:restriction endonuclease [Saccharothrix tamanrassetensis]MBB5958896.1 hypothetical protein [Saccharothrix tamanrassetensis]
MHDAENEPPPSSARPGLDLELLAHQIFSELEGDRAVVKHNDRILGRLSGAQRQIDVSIRWSDATKQPRLAVVEVKDRGRRADLTDLDKLATVLRDTGADRGVLVSNRGFTAPALRYARNLGIELYALHDSVTGRWRDVLKLPVLWTTLTPVLSGSLSHHAEAGDTIYSDDRVGWFANLSDDGGKTRIRIPERFTDLWNSRQLDIRADGPVKLISTKPVQIYVTDVNNEPRWRPVYDFVISYTVRRRYWLGHVDPVECRGLVDLLSHRIVPSYVHWSEVPLSRDESWVEIEDPHAVPVRANEHLYSIEDAVIDPNNFRLGNSQEIRNATTGELENRSTVSPPTTP